MSRAKLTNYLATSPPLPPQPLLPLPLGRQRQRVAGGWVADQLQGGAADDHVALAAARNAFAVALHFLEVVRPAPPKRLQPQCRRMQHPHMAAMPAGQLHVPPQPRDFEDAGQLARRRIVHAEQIKNKILEM